MTESERRKGHSKLVVKDGKITKQFDANAKVYTESEVQARVALFKQQAAKWIEGYRIVKAGSIGPLFDAGWNAAIKHLSKEILSLSPDLDAALDYQDTIADLTQRLAASERLRVEASEQRIAREQWISEEHQRQLTELRSRQAAEIAAAYEDAASLITNGEKKAMGRVTSATKFHATQIRKRTPADAKAALGAQIANNVKETLQRDIEHVIEGPDYGCSCELCTVLRAQIASAEARGRVEEAKWWHWRLGVADFNEGVFKDEVIQRIAALEKQKADDGSKSL